MKKRRVWIVGRVNSENIREWEFQGVFDDKDKAIAACKGPDWFVGPAVLNRVVSEESQPWPGAYYPVTQVPEPIRYRPSNQELRKVEFFTAVRTARLVRRYLKRAYPFCRFSVRTNRASGVITVRWTNGPEQDVVQAELAGFSGIHIAEGVIHSTYYTYSWLLPSGWACPAGSDWTPGGGTHWEPKPESKARLVLFICSVHCEREMWP